MEIRTLTLLTDAPLPLTGSELPFSVRKNGTPRELTDRLEEEARLRECDLFGVAPAERLAAIVPDLKAIFEGEVEYVGRNKADSFHKPYDPVVTKEARRVWRPGRLSAGREISHRDRAADAESHGGHHGADAGRGGRSLRIRPV